MKPAARSTARRSTAAHASTHGAEDVSARRGGVQRNARADAAWVADAVTRYESPLVQYCTRLLRGDLDRARDVVQDAFLKLWTADRAAIDGHLGQWLYRVCRNRALDIRRKEQRMNVMPEECIAAQTDTHTSDAQRAGEPLAPQMFALLDSLTEMQAEALRLKFQGGLSYKEIAAVMEITANHVGVIIHNAIKLLRQRADAATAPAPSAHVMRGES